MSEQTLRCSLTLADGSRRALTGLRSWELVRTDGDACDSFSVTADLPASGLGRLTEAVGFLAEHGGVRVFTGLIDEYELALDANGSALCVHGRGMGARLLDNQVVANVWHSAQLADILATYVTSYGLKASACALPSPKAVISPVRDATVPAISVIRNRPHCRYCASSRKNR